MKKIIYVIILLLVYTINVNALTKAPVDITTISLTEIEECLNKGIISSEQLVNMYLERIEEYNKNFNAIRVINENALDEAIKLDEMRKNGKVLGPLHGIPILVKTNIDVYGLPTTAGTKSLIDNEPLENAEAIQKLINQGAIIIASTNMSEFALIAGSSYSSYGNVKNIFDTDYTPFGSSGGSAVALKASFGAAALGTDTNLSVRVPASGAGLIGMRPTLYTVSSKGVIPYDVERDTIGILSKTVTDNALLLSIISDNNYTINISNLENVTIGVLTQYTKGSKYDDGVTGLTDEQIYELVQQSVSKLKQLGAKIVYINDFVKYSNLVLATNSASGLTFCDGFNEYIKGTTSTIKSFKQLVNSSGHIQPIEDYLSSCNTSSINKSKRDTMKKTYRDYVDEMFQKYEVDIVIYPTMKNQVPLLKEASVLSPGGSLPSVIGYPAITVPMGTIDKFSYGLEFMGKSNSEEKLYNITSQFESINNYNAFISPLTPPLYEVPEIVNNLVTKYLKGEIKDNLIKKVKDYFQNYNDIEDITIEAKKILWENQKKAIIISKPIIFTNLWVYNKYY